MNYKTHNFEQGTDDWFEVRKAKITASHAQAIGNNGKGLETYIFELMADFYSQAEKDQFSTKDTERGNELEVYAREMYELENDVVVEQVGFVETDKHVGCSPDGLVGKDGLLEIKCLNDVKHYKILVKGEKEIESQYIWQVQMQLLLTGRKYVDLMFYNPNFKESTKIFRIKPDKTKQAKLEVGILAGVEMIKKLIK